MAHELRKLMASADHGGTLGGPETQVEMDETFIGSRQKQSDRRKRGTNKITVFGMVERDGVKIVVRWPNTGHNPKKRSKILSKRM